MRTELPRYVAGELTPQAQDDEYATMAPLLDKEHGRIDWDKPSDAVHKQIRGMNPWPGAHTVLGDRHIKVHRSVASTLDPEGALPGQVIALDPEGILVACAEGTLEIQEIQ